MNLRDVKKALNSMINSLKFGGIIFIEDLIDPSTISYPPSNIALPILDTAYKRRYPYVTMFSLKSNFKLILTSKKR
jgi:hypothetical protein